MTEEHSSNTVNRLSIGTKAPMIDTIDVFDKAINLTNIAQENRGVIIEIFRGAW